MSKLAALLLLVSSAYLAESAKDNPFEAASRYLERVFAMDDLKLNKRIAQEYLWDEKYPNDEVKDIFRKFVALQTDYVGACNEESLNQVGSMVDLMVHYRPKFKLNMRASSQGRLEKLVIQTHEQLFEDCLKELGPEFDQLQLVLPQEKDQDREIREFNALIRYRWFPSGVKREALVYDFQKANYKHLTQISSIGARFLWVDFFKTKSLRSGIAIFEDQLKHGLKVVWKENVARLYQRYVTNRCSVFKGDRTENVMSRLERVVEWCKMGVKNRNLGPYERMLEIMFNHRICKELGKQEQEVMISKITKLLGSWVFGANFDDD